MLNLLSRSVVNGQIYFVVPGRLLLFSSPRLGLPPGQHWIDVDGRREFSPSFYADLFEFLGVSAVLRLDAAAGYDPADFTRRDIAVADLHDPDDPAAGGEQRRLSFGELDRFMRHMDSTPGLVALHFPCHDPHARTLVGTYIARRMRPGGGCPPAPSSPSSPRRRRSSTAAAAAAAEAEAEAEADTFSAREAVAWLHMAHPCPTAGWQRVAGLADDEPGPDAEEEPCVAAVYCAGRMPPPGAGGAGELDAMPSAVDARA